MPNTSIMKALVTGGAGFIGSNLVAGLLTTGHSVRVLDNLSSGYFSNLGKHAEAEFIKGDIRNPDIVEKALAGIEVVFHMAASVGNKRALDDPITDAEVNLIGTLRLLQAARKTGVRKIVFSSSAGIFGELKTLPIREDHPIEPISPYGVSKLAAEKECLAYTQFTGLECVCLRYFNVYGVNQRYDMYGNVIPIFAFQILAGEPLTIFGDGEQTRDFLNVRDVVQANIKAGLSQGLSGAFNLGSGSRITINHLVDLLKNASGVHPVVRYGPPRFGDVRDSLADISSARRALGFEPVVKLEQGLPEYFEWARHEAQRNAA